MQRVFFSTGILHLLRCILQCKYAFLHLLRTEWHKLVSAIKSDLGHLVVVSFTFCWIQYHRTINKTRSGIFLLEISKSYAVISHMHRIWNSIFFSTVKVSNSSWCGFFRKHLKSFLQSINVHNIIITAQLRRYPIFIISI